MQDTTYRRPIAWASCAATHTGKVRELNEDAIMSHPECEHWAVADGMGGHKVGDLASQKIVEGLQRLQLPTSLEQAVDDIEDQVIAVNRELQDYAIQHLEGSTVGSTLVDLVIRGRVGVCLWAGDSRLYRYRRHRLEQITRDHSQVADMVQMGLLTEDEARAHKASNVITRAVGVEDSLYLDATLVDTQLGDIFLLCSDGLHGVLESKEIADILECRDPQKCIDGLIERALEAGAPDNISAIVIKGEPGKVSRNESEGTPFA
jgi:protein phosphatase